MNATIKQSMHYLNQMDFETVRAMRCTYFGDIYFRYVDAMVSELTGFKSINDMSEAKGSYRPSLNVSDSELGDAFTRIADAYDYVMEMADDTRRAFRF